MEEVELDGSEGIVNWGEWCTCCAWANHFLSLYFSRMLGCGGTVTGVHNTAEGEFGVEKGDC